MDFMIIINKNQEQMLQGRQAGRSVQVGKGGMNYAGQPRMGFGVDGIYNGTYMFRGNSIQIQTRLQSLDEQARTTIQDATINIQGTLTKDLNCLCLMLTFMIGAILIFPLFFMCCEWWKRYVLAVHEIPLQSYQSLQKLISSENLKNLQLIVNDNLFNAQKAHALYEMISSSGLRSFIFINEASQYDVKDQVGYTNFINYMKPIKNLPIATEIRWSKTLVM